MPLNDYFQQRAVQEPEFRAEREALRRKFAFRRALIRARLNAELTQQALAERVGTRQSAIARLERGMAQPSFDMLLRLSNALNVSFEIMPSAEIHVHLQDNIPA